MIAALKTGITMGIAAFLAMCITGPPVNRSVHHSPPKKHHKIVHEYYPTPTPEAIIIPVSLPVPVLAPVPAPISTPTPWYKTTSHKNPPWSHNYRPDN